MRRRGVLSPIRLLAEQSLPSRRSITVEDVERLLKPGPGKTPTFTDRDLGVRFQVRPEEYDAYFTPEVLNRIQQDPMSRDDLLQYITPDPNQGLDIISRPEKRVLGGEPIGLRMGTSNMSGAGPLRTHNRVMASNRYDSYIPGMDSRTDDMDIPGYREMLMFDASQPQTVGSTSHFSFGEGLGEFGPYAHMRFDADPDRPTLYEMQSDFYSTPMDKDPEARAARVDEARRRFEELREPSKLFEYGVNVDDIDLWPPDLVSEMIEGNYRRIFRQPSIENYTQVAGNYDSPKDFERYARDLDLYHRRLEAAKALARDQHLRMNELQKAQSIRGEGPHERIWDRMATNAFLDGIFKIRSGGYGPRHIDWASPEMQAKLYYGSTSDALEGNAMPMYDKMYNRMIPDNIRRAFRNLGIDPDITPYGSRGESFARSDMDWAERDLWDQPHTMRVPQEVNDRVQQVIEKYGSAFPLYKDGGLIE